MVDEQGNRSSGREITISESGGGGGDPGPPWAPTPPIFTLYDGAS